MVKTTHHDYGRILKSVIMRVPLIFLPCSLIHGCAGYELTPISPGSIDGRHGSGEDANSEEGYVFYEPQPFLLGRLVQNSPPSYEFEVIYLPNHNRPYRFTRYEFFAASNLDISFKDGWMFTGADSHTDTTKALGHLVGLAEGMLSLLQEEAVEDPPLLLLFRIDTSTDEILQFVDLHESILNAVRRQVTPEQGREEDEP